VNPALQREPSAPLLLHRHCRYLHPQSVALRTEHMHHTAIILQAIAIVWW
jgi:hypothetical protein